jgi:hypothetical protein
MTSALIPIRAIATELANRVFVPVALTSAGLSILLVGGVMWLSTIGQLWLLLLVPVVMAICVAIGVLTIIKLTLITIRPAQTAVQKNAVAAYVKNLQRLSEITQTPRVVLLFRVVRDASAPSKDGFVGTLTHDTIALKKYFQALQKLF